MWRPLVSNGSANTAKQETNAAPPANHNTEFDRGENSVPAAIGATVEERRPRVEAMPDPEPRKGAGKTSGVKA